ncbi:MAG: hypothetical protein QM713_09840 [Arachnia sp.]
MKFTRNGLLTTLLVVAALFIGSQITTHLPQPEFVLGEAPFLSKADVGEPVRLRTGDVTVTGVRSAKRVELYRQVAESPGVWLVVDLTWAPRDAPSGVPADAPELVAADGRRFGGTQAVINTCGPAQPGMPVACQFPFEVPTDALEGIRLLVPTGGSTRASDDVAEVDLGIDADRAAQLSATDEQVALETSTVVKR